MENNEQTKKNHTCPVNGGHCCECNGCGNMCTHGGMRSYWRRHFIVLIVAVILAFFVGLKIGEIKGWVMGSYGMMPMRHGWMMQDNDRGPRPAQYDPAAGTVLEGTPQPIGADAAVR